MNCEEDGLRDSEVAASEKAARRLLNPFPLLLLFRVFVDDAERAAAREEGTILCSVKIVRPSCMSGTIAS
jgi:hypothetical protein